jgi:hypothetical protein
MLFDPADLQPAASLNRNCIAALPGAIAEWVGRPAQELLSARAPEALSAALTPTATARVFGQRLAHLIATLTSGAALVEFETEAFSANARMAGCAPQSVADEAVTVDSPTTRVVVSMEFVARLESGGHAVGPAGPDPTGRSAAARDRRLAGVPHEDGGATAADTASRAGGAQARDAAGVSSGWRQAYLRRWTEIERVWLGGGIVAALGPELLDATRSELDRLVDSSLSVSVGRSHELGAAPSDEFAQASQVAARASHESSRGVHQADGPASHEVSQAPHDGSRASHQTSQASHEAAKASHDVPRASHESSEAPFEGPAASHEPGQASHDVLAASHGIGEVFGRAAGPSQGLFEASHDSSRASREAAGASQDAWVCHTRARKRHSRVDQRHRKPAKRHTISWRRHKGSVKSQIRSLAHRGASSVRHTRARKRLLRVRRRHTKLAKRHTKSWLRHIAAVKP